MTGAIANTGQALHDFHHARQCPKVRFETVSPRSFSSLNFASLSLSALVLVASDGHNPAVVMNLLFR